MLGAFGPGSLENYYVKGLRNYCASIDVYDTTREYYDQLKASIIKKVVNKIAPSVLFANINKKVLSYIGQRKFDVIIIFKGLTLYPETVSSLKGHTRLLVNYNPDHPFRFFSEGSGNSNILNSIQQFDIYLTYAKKISDELKSQFKVQSDVLPFGFDDQGFNKNISSLDCNDRILFIGAYDKERSAFLSKLKIQSLDIYGDDKWHSRNMANTYLQGCYKNKSLYDDEYKNAINSAGGVINILRQQNIVEQSHNMRTFEVPGYGGLLLANRTEEQMAFFEDGKEALYFDSVDELKGHIDFILKEKKIAQKIKENAYNRAVESGYSYTARSKQLFNMLKRHL
jgi:spore maturation protein CgeB